MMQNENKNQLLTNSHTSTVKLLWRIGLILIAAFVVFLVLLSFFTPSFDELENPKFSVASQVLANDGSELGNYFIENRVPVNYNQLSPYLVKALISTEDKRFNDHSGVDAEALLRVLFRTFLLRQKGSGGGSTITQQLAKMLYSDRNFEGMNFVERIFAYSTRKFGEMITAVKLEKRYSKEEILTMYLNKVNFVNGAYGIKAASEIYFGKSQKDLNVEESATIIGMLQNPSLFNPMRRPKKVKDRRNEVFLKMQRMGFIDDKMYAILKEKPLDMSRFKAQSHAVGMAPYFRSELAKDVQNILNKKEYTKADGSKYNIYKDGLKIYTTIDPTIQRLAEEAMVEHMSQLQRTFFGVWKGKDPWTNRDEDTEDYEIETRKNYLKRAMRESERYDNIRSKYLDEVLEKINGDVEGTFIKDSDIDKMLEEEKKPGTVKKEVKKKLITSIKADMYSKIMQSGSWSNLKKQWSLLQSEVKVEFARPVLMKIFDYSPSGEKEVTMTPMDSIRYHRMILQLGSLAMDPKTGFIKAWVGGVNYKYFQYDHIRTNRQVGSTFKPFIYATAIFQQGISPCFKVLDVAQTISVGEGSFHLEKPWTPKNAKGYTGKSFTLWDALRESKNTVSVFLMKQIGSTEPVRGLIKNMGIDSSKVPAQPSICLGSCDLNVFEMSGAYTTFANNGVYNKPIYITRIENNAGKIIYNGMPEEHTALPENANYVMVQMLKKVANDAKGFSEIKSEVGGKTGTTNKFVDGWYMGITPNLVVGTWVGGEDSWIRFLDLEHGQGGYMARPFFVRLMKKIESNQKLAFDTNAKFNVPKGDIGITLDCSLYSAGTSAPVQQSGFDGGDPFEGEENQTLPNTKAPDKAVKKSDEDPFGGNN
jgi:penicillin-binding protein 1A